MEFNDQRFSKLVGLIGEGIQASRSPLLHEHEAQALGLRYFYQLIDLQKPGVGVAALPSLLEAAQTLGFAGVNITHPCKQAVLPLLDDLSKDAAAIGAVNTVVFTDGKRIGYNTDWYGFAESFKRGLPDVALDQVVLLGAGGAGAAVAYALLKLGAKHLAIYDVDRSRASALTQSLIRQFGECVVVANDLNAALANADGAINATPIGMYGYSGLPLSVECLHPEMWVAEVVYFPLETELLQQAKKIGCQVLNGGGMAVFQAAEAFRLFSGITPNVERMQRHFDSLVGD